MRTAYPTRSAILACLALSLALPFSASGVTQYGPNSNSAFNAQRRLEAYTNQIVDSCRSQRNSTGNSSSGSARPYIAPWKPPQTTSGDYKQERGKQRDKLISAGDAWRTMMAADAKRSPAERAQRNAENARAAERQRLAASLQREADFAKAREALIQRDWDAYRSRVGGYAPRTPVPDFSSAAASVDWLLKHHAQQPNEWAQVRAASLLTDGVRGPVDVPGVLALLAVERSPAGAALHPARRVLHCYLKALPTAAAGTVGEAEQGARRDLLELAKTDPLARWYGARLLSFSEKTEERREALRLLPDGYWCILDHPAPGVYATSDSSFALRSTHVHDILQRCAGEWPQVLGELKSEELGRIAKVVSSYAGPEREVLWDHFGEAIARTLGTLPETDLFNYSDFGNFLVESGNANSSASCGLSALLRLQLLDIDDLSPVVTPWREHWRSPATIDALERWASTPGKLGARSRLALGLLAEEAAKERPRPHFPLPEVAVWHAARAEVDRLGGGPGASEAIKRRDDARKTAAAAFKSRLDSAPDNETVKDLPPLLRDYHKDMLVSQRLESFADTASVPGLAVSDKTFDLDKADALYDRALVEEISLGQRRALLLEATLLGGAEAPGALSSLCDSDRLRDRLRKLAVERQARDAQAGRPRARVVAVLRAALSGTELDGPLQDALSQGSILARSLQLNRHIARHMSDRMDRPPSWRLPAERIAELDEAVLALGQSTELQREFNLHRSLTLRIRTMPAENLFKELTAWREDMERRDLNARMGELIKPAILGLTEELKQWPGIDLSLPEHADARQAAQDLRSFGEDALYRDAPLALKCMILATSKGDNTSLALLMDWLRAGVEDLPKMPQIAELLEPGFLRMMQANGELGDPVAAYTVGARKLDQAKDQAAFHEALKWLGYAAERGNMDAALQIQGLYESGGEFLAPDQKQADHWTKIGHAIADSTLVPCKPWR